MKDKDEKWLLIFLAGCVLAGIACVLAAIWTEDDRWWWTAGVFAFIVWAFPGDDDDTDTEKEEGP